MQSNTLKESKEMCVSKENMNSPSREETVVVAMELEKSKASESEFKHHDYYLDVVEQHPSDVLEKLGTSFDGLEDEEVQRRLKLNGRNELPGERFLLLKQLYHALFNPFNLLLLCLALITFLTGDGGSDSINALIMLCMIIVSFSVTFVQEHRSSNATEKLKKMITKKAVVWRKSYQGSSSLRDVPISELVVGDIIKLSAGDIIPADVVLFESTDLQVSQSALTGESMPVEKYVAHARAIQRTLTSSSCSSGGSADIFDSASLCFMGTNVVSGSAAAVVLKTGSDVYLSSLAKSIAGNPVMTSFDRDVRKYVYFMGLVILIMAPLVFVINYATKGEVSESLLFAVSVAVGLVPEMLPMIVAVNLAKGASVMAKKKVVIKRLNVVQNLGAMDVLCTDKTGTLTDDNIALQHYCGPDGEVSSICLEFAYLNSSLQTGLRNILDKAVSSFCEDLWDDKHKESVARQYTKIDELPFDFVRKRMSVVLAENTKFSTIEKSPVTLVCKGAVEDVMRLCTHTIDSMGNCIPVCDNEKNELLKVCNGMNRKGLRVIAVATKSYDCRQVKYEERDMTFQGYLAFLDPPKESAKEAISLIRDAGVQVKVLTGDNDAVSSTVCSKVGIETGNILLGSTIEQMSDDDLAEAVENVQLFAKLTPMQKLRIVKQLQGNGHIVGFLGDGINDAPALNQADAGISVDNAVDISKEAADIILLEKNLMVLFDGIVEGRKVFANILKYIKMGISSNFGNVFSVLGSSALLPFLPMAPIQLLTQNLLYDISQIAIPWDNVDAEFLALPHRWDIVRDIGRFMVCIGPLSSIFDYATFGVMWYYFNATDPNNDHEVSLFQTGWFCEGLLTQTIIVHIIRTHKVPVFQSRPSLSLFLLTVVIMAIGLAIPYTPLGDVLAMTSLPGTYYGFLVLFIVSYVVLTQCVKHMYVRRWGIY